MLRLVRRDVTDSRKNVRTMRCTPLDAVPMVDTTLSSFVVYVEVREVVVEVYGAGAKVTSEQRGVRSENGGDVDMSFAAQRDGEPSLPLVEVRNDCLVKPGRYVLFRS